MANAIIVRPLPLGTVTAEGSAAGTLPTYLGNDYLGVVHRSTATTSAFVQCDLGSAQPVDFAAFLSSNAIGAQTLQVRGDSDSATTTSPVYDSGAGLPFQAGSALPTSGRSNSWWDIAAAQTLRYWRFDIGALGGVAFDAGRLVVGKKIQLGRNFSYGLARGAQGLGSAEFTKDGALLRRYGRVLRTLDIAWESATQDEAETQLLPLIERVANTDPILIVTDPAAHAQRQNRMYFGWLRSELKVPIKAYDVWQWRATLWSVI